MHNKYNHFWSYIALVLDLPVPVDVVDGVGTVGGDPGDGLEALVGEETLTIVGWIEEKKNIFLCLVQLHEELVCRARVGWNSALHSPRFLFSSLPFLRNVLMSWVTLCLTWITLAEISSTLSPVDLTDMDWSSFLRESWVESVHHLQELTGRPRTLIWASWLCWLLSPSIPILDLLTVLGVPSSHLCWNFGEPNQPSRHLTVCRALLSE